LLFCLVLKLLINAIRVIRIILNAWRIELTLAPEEQIALCVSARRRTTTIWDAVTPKQAARLIQHATQHLIKWNTCVANSSPFSAAENELYGKKKQNIG
jgi:hypothetical protein